MSKKGEGLLIAAGIPVPKRSESEDDDPMKSEDDAPSDDVDLSEGEKTAAEDAMVALKDEDSEAFGKALKRFLQMGS